MNRQGMSWGEIVIKGVLLLGIGYVIIVAMSAFAPAVP